VVVANTVVQISVVARIVTIQVVTRIALPVRLQNLKRKEKERKKRISITSSWHKSVSALVTKQQTHGRNQKRLALKDRKKERKTKIEIKKE
jgi:arginine/lysine/ornithine decarboxylase